MANKQKSKGNSKNYKGNNGYNKNGKGDNKGRRGNNKSKPNNKGGDEVPAGQNDPSWYKATDQIARDAGQFSFNNPLGMTLNGVVDTVYSGVRNTVPGVTALRYIPTLGDSADTTSPVNLQARKLLSYLQANVSAKLNAASSDFMMYLVAMDNMYAYYSFLVRLYGLKFSYISMNRYYPAALIKAMGVNANASSDWNKLRTWINTFAYQLSQLYVPSTMTYFQRHMWMNANVYLDAPDSKSQSYLFVPTHMYKWDGSTDPMGTKLVLTKMPNATYAGGATLDQLMEFGDSLLTELLQDIDIASMSGLILRAFGENNCFKMNTVPEDFMVSPIYNPEVLSQIHNATIVGDIYTDGGLGNITQTEFDTLSVSYVTTVSSVANLTHLGKSRIIDLDIVSPTIDDTFVATRLMVYGESIAGNPKNYQLVYYGTEVVTGLSVFSLGTNGAITSSDFSTSVYNHADDNLGIRLADTSAFNKFPLLFSSAATAGGLVYLTGIIGDLDNYTILSPEDLRKIHSASTIALFNIPLISRT